MLTDTMLRIPLSQIEVPHDRQRRKIFTTDLLHSISRRGVVTPIVVEQTSSGNYLLVTGERRLTASRELGIPDIPARLAGSLSESERKIIELEENIKRLDLEWPDFCQAIRRIHALYLHLDSDWTQSKTADSIGLEDGTVSIILRVAGELQSGNTQLLTAPNYRAAYNIISRKDSRRLDDAFNSLIGDHHAMEIQETESLSMPASTSKIHTSAPKLASPDPVRCEDFIDFARDYSGAPFTFLHCDFPYGIELDKSAQGNSDSWGGYADDEPTYWKLCECLALNLDKLMMPYSHLMFWCSSNFTILHKTLQFFSTKAPSLDFNPTPLIWHKTDNKGILPDPKRGPRHVYETALFASRGDRLIAQSVSDTYGAPKGDAKHQSEKSEPMLRYFFRMFIDDSTSVLDPTCGSGSALCAALDLGASRICGLEINAQWAADANARIRKHRILRSINP